MSSSGAIRSGRAFVEIFADDGPMQRQLRRVSARLKAWARSASALADVAVKISRGGDTLIAGGLAMAVPVVAGLRKIAMAASNAEESLNRFKQVFGEQEAAASRFADRLADEVGRSSVAVRDAMAMFQGFGVGQGFDPSSARQMSEALTRLGLDMASFNNLSDEEAMQKLLAAMSGSGEVLQRYGIDLKEAAIQQEALARGWDAKALSEQQKSLLRLSIIARKLGDQGAIGDATRTAGSFANVAKRLRAQLEDLAVAVGQQLLPTLTQLIGRVAAWLEQAMQWVKANPGLVKSLLGAAIGAAILGAAILATGVALKVMAVGFYTASLAIAPLRIGLSLTAVALRGLAASLGLIPAAMSAATSPIVMGVAAVAALAAAAIYASGALEPLKRGWADLRNVVSVTFDAIRNRIMAGDIAGAAKVLWAGVQAVWNVALARLREAWDVFRFWFAQKAIKAFYDVALMANDSWAAIRRAWAGLGAWFSDLWTGVKGVAKEAWAWIVNLATKAANEVRGAFDSSFDVKAANAQADAQKTQSQQGAESAMMAEMSATQQALDQKRAEIEQDRNRAEQSLGASMKEWTDATGNLVDEARKAGDAAVEQAVAELQSRIRAVEQAAPGTSPTPGGETPDFQGMLDQIASTIQGGSEVAARAGGGGADGVGSFDARVIAAGLAPRDRDVRETAANTKEGARLLRQLVDRSGNLVFG